MFISLRKVFELIARPSRSFAFRDRVLAYYAPIGLLLLPVTWVIMVLLGYTGIYWGTGINPLSEACHQRLVALHARVRPARRASGTSSLSFSEAFVGLGIVALLISYLPSIYGAFSRREVLVGKLEVRAGLPPSPAELLTRYARIGGCTRSTRSCSTPGRRGSRRSRRATPARSPSIFLRSPHPGRSWITAAGCVLDTAAISASLIAKPHDARADIMLRGGFFCLRRIADYFGIAYDPDPARTTPSPSRRREFDLLCVELRGGGRPAQARPGPGVAGLRRLAGQLRHGAGGAVRAGDGAAGGVVVRPPHRRPAADQGSAASTMPQR